MKFNLKNIANKIGDAASVTWKFFLGKKRLIAIGCGLISQIIPEYTTIGGGADWIKDNIDYVTIGFEIAAGLFGTTAIVEHGIEAYNNKLPSGLTDRQNSEGQNGQPDRNSGT